MSDDEFTSYKEKQKRQFHFSLILSKVQFLFVQSRFWQKEGTRGRECLTAGNPFTVINIQVACSMNSLRLAASNSVRRGSEWTTDIGRG